MIEQFKNDVDQGLSNSPKTLPSKYFYNKIGDALFVKIMHSDEYYLTRSELEIFQTQSHEIAESFGMNKSTYFELIELGAGDGLKTKELLRQLCKESYSFGYFPVDISQNALDNLQDKLNQELPEVEVVPKQGDYFKVLQSLKNTQHPKVVLFLGSNIGNMQDDMASDFIYELGANLHKNDKLLLGVDLMKSSDLVLPAYNDKQGYTRDFNLNLLQRINDELGGNFNLNQFKHRPEYDEQVGVAKSFLESMTDQKVYIDSLDKEFEFKKGEKIQTERSRKYNDEVLQNIIRDSDFSIIKKFTDSRNYFADYLLSRNESK